MTWYIAQNGQPKQIPEEVLLYKIQNEELPSDTLVVNEELKEWTPLKEVSIWQQNAPASHPAHLWQCSKCGRMIDQEPCPYCHGEETAPTTENADTPASVPPRQNRIARLISMILLAGLALFVFWPQLTAPKLRGQYTHDYGGLLETLAFSADGKVKQYVGSYSGGFEEAMHGTYTFDGENVVYRLYYGNTLVYDYDREHDQLWNRSVGFYSRSSYSLP